MPAPVRTLATMAIQRNTPIIVQMLASSPMLISVLDSVLLGAIVALLMLQLGGATVPAVASGAFAFVVAIGVFQGFAGRQIGTARAGLKPMFPTREVPAPRTSRRISTSAQGGRAGMA